MLLTVQESRELGKPWGRVRVYKIQDVFDLVTDLRAQRSARFESKLERHALPLLLRYTLMHFILVIVCLNLSSPPVSQPQPMPCLAAPPAALHVTICTHRTSLTSWTSPTRAQNPRLGPTTKIPCLPQT